MKNNILLLILIFICVSCQSEVNHNVPDKNIYVRKELSKQELNNLEAISRLYGYVRYFYPHTETKKFKELDWYKFLVYSIDKTIYSKNDEELKTNLLNVFQPIIPNLSFNEDSNPMGTPTKSSTIYYWKHRGIGKHLSGDSTFISKLVEGTNLNNAGLVADSMYEFPLNERLNIYYPLALSNISNQKNKDWEKTKKEVSKIKFRLFNKSTLQLLLGDEDRSWALLKDDKFRYADLIVRWNIIQHFYPYYNEEHLDETWSSRLCSALKKAGIVENESQYLDTVYWLLAGVNDSHITIRRDAYVGGMSGTYVRQYAAPLELDWLAEKQIYISNVPDSLKGILAKGDILAFINNIPIDSIINSKWDYISASTFQGKMEKLIENRLLNSFVNDSILKITAINALNEQVEFEVKTNAEGWINTHQNKNEFIKNIDNIYYINLASHDENATYDLFKSNITNFKKAKGIILDVRGYPNATYTDHIVSHFSKARLVSGNFERPYYLYPNQIKVIYANEGNGLLQENSSDEYIPTPICILINHKAMSYAETIIGLLKDQTECVLIGQNTIGANGDVSEVKLPLFYFTLTALKDPGGYHNKGIDPDIIICPTIEDIRQNKDSQLETAINYINELDANNTAR